jgi:hypothetical protein
LLRALEALLPARLADEVCGDLLEECASMRAGGRRRAGVFLAAQLLSLPLSIAWRRAFGRPGRPPRRPADHGGPSMSQILLDLRYALRSLRRRPGFTAVIVLTLALAIGANAAVFALVDGLVLHPFPIPEIDRLVMLFETRPDRGADRIGASPANFLDWRDRVETVEGLSAFWSGDFNLTGGDRPERVVAARVSPGFLTLLGVEPELGRDLQTSTREADQERTVVLSHQLWQRRYGAGLDVLGRTVLIDDEEFTVVGVGREAFDYPAGSEMWMPLAWSPETAGDRRSHYLSVIGRLAPGRSLAEAREELAVLGARLADRHPEA